MKASANVFTHSLNAMTFDSAEIVHLFRRGFSQGAIIRERENYPSLVEDTVY